MFNGQAAIAVLGPSDAASADEVTDLCRQVGAGLAQIGYVVVVEGGGPVAETTAASAIDAGGAVVSIRAEGDPALTTNKMTEEVCEGALGSIGRILEIADAVVILPGDLRATAVLLQIWTWGLSPTAPYRQTILLGKGWPKVLQSLADSLKLDQKRRAMVTMAREPDEAVEALRYYVSAS